MEQISGTPRLHDSNTPIFPMLDSFYIAWKYISFNKIKTLTLVACVTLIAFLPMALELLLTESERQLMSRAASTPLVVGAKGSALDLMMNTLYFGDELPELLNMESSERVWESDLAVAIPMYIRFKAREYPIAGTTLDYFDFRKLEITEGQQLSILGDCVLGATVAQSLGLKVGESLVSSPENLFDLAGVYPLKMRIVGVLERSYTSDDLAIFTDIKTTWVIEGLGHGHQDVTVTQDDSVILDRTEGNVTANAKLLHYMEITEKNMDSFHFHGDLTEFPVTSVLAVPYDEKSGTILRGRYLAQEDREQIVKPEEVIESLLQTIFRIKNVLDAVIGVVGLTTVLAMILVFALSLRLRRREIDTIFKLGCQRMTIGRLLASEIVIIVFISGVFCALLMWLVNSYANDVVRMLFIR